MDLRPVRLLIVVLLSMAGSGLLPDHAKAEGTLEKWFRILGLSASTAQQKGPGDEVEGGEVWVADVNGMARIRWTSDGGYRSPVFLPNDRSVLALKGDSLVRIPAFGADPVPLFQVKGVRKLIGVPSESPEEALVLTEDADGRTAPALVSLKTGKIEALPFDSNSPEERRLLRSLAGWDRGYGDATLTVDQTREAGLGGTRAWSDVYYQRPGQEKRNVSQCERVSCGQPSLSHDLRQVVFTKGRSR